MELTCVIRGIICTFENQRHVLPHGPALANGVAALSFATWADAVEVASGDRVGWIEAQHDVPVGP